MPTTPTDVQVPSRLPVVPGVVLHGSYLLTDREPLNRGDTLDAIVLPDQRLALIVLDVVGHGFPASMAATQSRTVLRERLLAGAGATGAARALDAYLRHLPEIGAVSLCIAVLDPETGAVEHMALGHPGPVTVGPDGGLRRVATEPHAPLGVGDSGQPPAPGSFGLREGELLLLLTDGLTGDGAVARPGIVAAPSDDVDDAPADRIDRWCGEIIEALVPSSGLDDDGVVLAAMRVGRAAPLSLSLPARRDSVEHVRRALDQWLDEVGAGLLDHAGLVQALDEITTNVVRHAYRGHDGPMSAGANLDGAGRAVVTVTDHGTWSPEAPLGFGLMMAAGLADDFRVERGGAANTVELCHELNRPVSMLQTVPDDRKPDWDDEISLQTWPGKVAASGAVDDLAAEMFHAALNEATEAGSRGVLVDLVDATRLASPGVQTLHEFQHRGRACGLDVDVVARRGSCVAEVLRVTAVAHRTIDAR